MAETEDPATESTRILFSKKVSGLLAQGMPEKIVANAVVSGLSHFGDKRVVESLLFILEVDYGVSLNKVALNLNSFRRGIDAMFGEASVIVEDHIRAELAKRIGVRKEDRTFEELIDMARHYGLSQFK